MRHKKTIKSRKLKGKSLGIIVLLTLTFSFSTIHGVPIVLQNTEHYTLMQQLKMLAQQAGIYQQIMSGQN